MNKTKILEKYWIFNGIFAALAVLSTVPNVTNLDRFEFLRASNAFINWWISVSQSVADSSSSTLNFYNFNAFDINSAFFLVFFAIPASFGVHRFDVKYFKIRNVNSASYKYPMIFAAALSFQVVFMSFLSPTVETGFERNPAHVFFSIIFLLIGIWQIPKFAKVLASVAIFLVSLQVLYLANTPWFHAYVVEFSCKNSGC